MKKLMITIVSVGLTYWAFQFMEDCLKYFSPEFCMKCLK